MPHRLSAREERLNTLTHGLGACFAAAAASWLIAESWRRGGQLELIGALAFGLSMVLMYIASTLYHDCNEPRQKARYKVLDHCAIYLLIAGTYTPFTLIPLRDVGGQWLFPTIWALAAAGIIFKLFFTGRFKLVSTLIYLAMGWLVVLVYKPLVLAISSKCLLFMGLGGAFYTLGAVVYLAKRLPYSHAIWHVFVMLGTGFHFAAVAIMVWR